LFSSGFPYKAVSGSIARTYLSNSNVIGDDMQLPNSKRLSLMWKISIANALLLGMLFTWGVIDTFKLSNFTFMLSPVAVYAIYTVTYYFLCKIGCLELKPFVTGIIDQHSKLKSEEGQEFNTGYVSFFSKNSGQFVNVYFFVTGVDDIDLYIYRYIRARDFALMLLWLFAIAFLFIIVKFR
jgi:hypothetical protein